MLVINRQDMADIINTFPEEKMPIIKLLTAEHKTMLDSLKLTGAANDGGGDTGADSDAQAKVLSDLNARVEKVSSDVQQVHCASAPTESGRPLPSGFADQFNHLTSLPGGDGDEAGEGQPASALRGRGAHGERRVIPRSTRRCEGLGAA